MIGGFQVGPFQPLPAYQQVSVAVARRPKRHAREAVLQPIVDVYVKFKGLHGSGDLRKVSLVPNFYSSVFYAKSVVGKFHQNKVSVETTIHDSVQIYLHGFSGHVRFGSLGVESRYNAFVRDISSLRATFVTYGLAVGISSTVKLNSLYGHSRYHAVSVETTKEPSEQELLEEIRAVNYIRRVRKKPK